MDFKEIGKLIIFIWNQFDSKPRNISLQSFLMDNGFPSYQYNWDVKAAKEVLLENVATAGGAGLWKLRDEYLLPDGERKNLTNLIGKSIELKIEQYKRQIAEKMDTESINPANEISNKVAELKSIIEKSSIMKFYTSSSTVSKYYLILKEAKRTGAKSVSIKKNGTILIKL